MYILAIINEFFNITEPIENYLGTVVVEKKHWINLIRIRREKTTGKYVDKWISVNDFDMNRYELGDVILSLYK